LGNNIRTTFVIENVNGGVMALGVRATSYKIRCVRDLTEGESNGSTDSDGGDGGGI
jgi:hypothetical protein